jgi:putative flippase GtrA
VVETSTPLAQKSVLNQFVRFGVVGTVGFVVNASMVELLNHKCGPLLAQTLAFPVAATVTWWLNRRYTFGASRYAIHHEWLRYIFANLLGWVVNNGLYVWMVLHFPFAFQHPSIAVAVGSIAAMFVNFSVSRLIVFRSD